VGVHEIKKSQKKFLDVIDAWVGGWKSKIFARTSFEQEEKRERRIAQHKRKKEGATTHATTLRKGHSVTLMFASPLCAT
jgi:hypothetical protein